MKAIFKMAKKPIYKKEYDILMQYANEHPQIKEHSRLNLKRVFTILYFTGVRVNEVNSTIMVHKGKQYLTGMRVKNIRELIEKGESDILLPKTRNIRTIYANTNFKNALIPLFNLDKEEDDYVVIRKLNRKMSSLAPLTVIGWINDVMFEALGDRAYKSHSFRQGFITSLVNNNNAPDKVASYMNVSINTIYNYYTPSKDIMMSLNIR